MSAISTPICQPVHPMVSSDNYFRIAVTIQLHPILESALTRGDQVASHR